MILDISRSIARSRIFRFPSRDTVGARLLRYLNRFTAYSIHANELELDRMILDNGPLHRSKLDFSISFQWACLLQFINRFTAYSSYAVELKLGGMIPDIIRTILRSRIFRFIPEGAVGAVRFAVKWIQLFSHSSV